MIFAYRNLEFSLLNEPLLLPANYIDEINRNWENEKLNGKSYTNGKIYTMASFRITGDDICIFLKESNFAHFLLSKKKQVNHLTCRSVAANVLLLTSDGYLAFGKMSNQTSLSNITKFIGGAISDFDLVGNKIDTTKTISRELKEETGIDLFDDEIVANFRPIFFLTRPNFSFINTLFLVNLNVSSSLLKYLFINYRDFLSSVSVQSELSDLVFVENSYAAAVRFLKDEALHTIDYMGDFINHFYNIFQSEDITNEITANLPLL